MNESIQQFLTAALAGAGLGALHFGTLLWTLHRLPGSRHAHILMLTSLVARTSASVAGFFWIGGARWQDYSAALIGFIAARTLLARRSTNCLGTMESI